MQFTFEATAGRYWFRVLAVACLIFGFGALPHFVPTASDPGGFILIVNLIGVVSLAVLFYVRPRELTLTIDESGVIIKDSMQRVLVAKRLTEVDEVSLGRWGHVLDHSIGWIVLREHGRSKPNYYGAISRERLDSTTIEELRSALKKTKAEQGAGGNGGQRR